MTVFTGFNWISADGSRINAGKWLPQQDNKAVIILIHGLGEHFKRYNNLAEFFNRKGISIYSFDQRGHGQSSGMRGHIESADVVCADIHHLINLVKSEQPGLPLILYGHSLGGNLVLYCVLKTKPDVQGVISTSPGLGVGTPVPKIKKEAAKLLSRFLPSFTIDNGLDVNNLSHDPQVIKDYKDDPLVHPKVSLKLATDMFANGEWIVGNAAKIPIPMLVLQGGMDHIVSKEMVEQFVNNAPEKITTYKLYPDLYHELHNEFEKQEVLAFIYQWIRNLVETENKM